VIAIVIVFGYAVSQLALLFGMDSDTQQGALRLIGLLTHLMLIAMVLQCRTRVAAWLEGTGGGRLGGVRPDRDAGLIGRGGAYQVCEL